ncbi:response regulator [Crocosphaera sp. Alani8]|uniref:response regulator n=1 Tax=Crocosphaera sp. Alani8 TaxID=3038952 RepID=UPI00313B662A
MNDSNREPEDCSILIVDDDRTMRNLLKIALEQEGYRTFEAKNGQQCLEQYSYQKPDMVLMDAIMPGIDGFTCCRQLRSLSNNNYVPILMITALDDQDSIDQAFAAGATDYVTKPIFGSVLLHRVNHLLSNGRTLRRLNLLESRLAKQQQWQRLEYQISHQWQKSSSLKSLLQDCLQQLQTHLEAERLGVYRIDGKLITEVIAPAYPSVKTFPWEEITLLRVYQSTYQQGKTVVLNFSENIALSTEQISFFEQLSLKNLTLVPLLVNNNLWGILWIHHCRVSYQWETWEIERLSHLSNLLAISSEIMK